MHYINSPQAVKETALDGLTTQKTYIQLKHWRGSDGIHLAIRPALSTDGKVVVIGGRLRVAHDGLIGKGQAALVDKVPAGNWPTQRDSSRRRSINVVLRYEVGGTLTTAGAKKYDFGSDVLKAISLMTGIPRFSNKAELVEVLNNCYVKGVKDEVSGKGAATRGRNCTFTRIN